MYQRVFIPQAMIKKYGSVHSTTTLYETMKIMCTICNILTKIRRNGKTTNIFNLCNFPSSAVWAIHESPVFYIRGNTAENLQLCARCGGFVLFFITACVYQSLRYLSLSLACARQLPRQREPNSPHLVRGGGVRSTTEG